LVCALAAVSALLLVHAHSTPATGEARGAAAAADTITVYATATGECYHVAGCPSLRHSAIPLTLLEAVARRLRPCQRCSPPQLDCGEAGPNAETEAAEPARLLPATLVRVVDGDTIRVVVQGRAEAVRLIGIDTPEITHGKNEPFGQAARDFLRTLLAGRSLWLEPGVKERDRYGRLLAYLWAQGAGDLAPVLANAQILRWGYAQLLTIPPNVKYVERFRAAQEAAQRDGLNLWRQ